MIFRWKLFSWFNLLTILFCLALATSAWADHGEKLHRVKAAFIFNIAKFVSWPDSHSNQEHLNICFYRTDFIGKGFDSIVGRDVHGKVVKSSTIQDLTHAKSCSILLISNEELSQYQLDYAASGPEVGLLTVADLTTDVKQGLLLPGVLLSLVRRGSSIGFDVSLKQVHERKLQMSSQLLKLANILDKEDI
ncbi:YfiR family protein [Neptuniibacter sp. QD29_5]|uniref:YfiR family protein n=1 Tax=Neptuniibacter sp. QD29_5 TaxID=3398207 RepID=UPI0039F581AC